MTTIDACLVSEHGFKKIKRGRNPSKPFLDIRNPKIAFQKATFYWNLIRGLFESKKHPESELSSILFVKNEQILQTQKGKGLANFLVRVKNHEGQIRKGQLDFYLLTEDGQFIDLNFHKPGIDNRYYLCDLQKDLRKMNQKLAYVILASPKMKDFYIFSFNQFNELNIGYEESSLPFCEEIKDDIDIKEKLEIQREKNRWKQIEKRRNNGETIHICPACDNEWNNSYCRYCGYPN